MLNIRGPYGFDLNESGQSCRTRGRTIVFLIALCRTQGFRLPRVLPRHSGGVLFLERQEPRGVFLLYLVMSYVIPASPRDEKQPRRSDHQEHEQTENRGQQAKSVEFTLS
jgi:hypothetical protein